MGWCVVRYGMREGRKKVVDSAGGVMETCEYVLWFEWMDVYVSIWECLGGQWDGDIVERNK